MIRPMALNLVRRGIRAIDPQLSVLLDPRPLFFGQPKAEHNGRPSRRAERSRRWEHTRAKQRILRHHVERLAKASLQMLTRFDRHPRPPAADLHRPRLVRRSRRSVDAIGLWIVGNSAKSTSLSSTAWTTTWPTSQRQLVTSASNRWLQWTSAKRPFGDARLANSSACRRAATSVGYFREAPRHPADVDRPWRINGSRAAWSFAAFSGERSISYDLPSMPKRRVLPPCSIT
jgi:hypothetical protein